LEIAVSKLVQTFEITDEGAMDDYLGVKAEKQEEVASSSPNHS